MITAEVAATEMDNEWRMRLMPTEFVQSRQWRIDFFARHLRAFAEANHPAQGDWSAEAAAKEAWAAYVKPVMVPNHPLPEPPVRWMIAVVPALQAAHDANRPAPPGGIVEAEAIEHLRNVLMVLAELSPDDRCQALDDALEFYNDHRPNAKIEPIEGFVSRLVNFTPMDRAMGTEVKSVTMESGENSAALLPTTLADVPDWEQIETAPRTGTFLDMWYGGARLADVYWCEEGDGWAQAGCLLAFPNRLTHWMYAPGPPNKATRKVECHGTGSMLMPLSDINDLDAVVASLGIADSDTTPAEAVFDLKAEIERLRAALAALPPTTLADVPAQEREAVRWALEHTIHRFPTSDGSDKLRSFLTRLDPKP